MRRVLEGFCPNCGAQIVLHEGQFSCSICNYDHEQWAAFLSSGHPDRRLVAGYLAKFPMHVDSPALLKEVS